MYLSHGSNGVGIWMRIENVNPFADGLDLLITLGSLCVGSSYVKMGST